MNRHQILEEIFRIYRYRISLAKSYDKLIETEAMNSYFYSITGKQSSEKSYTKIIKLIERKNLLINFKVKLENILKSIPDILKLIIYNKHIKLMKNEEIIEQLGLSVRTYFRRLEKAEEFILKSFNI